MKTMNIRPSFRYRFLETLTSAGVVFAIMVMIMAGFISLVSFSISNGDMVTGNISFFSFTATIALFVMGICSIREDIRLMLQNGIGRRTVFMAHLLSALSVSLLLAVAGELLIAFGQAFTASRSGFTITDLYQILYANGADYNLSLGNHVESIALSFSLYTCGNLAGIFISLLFYRLNKIWTLTVSIGTPLLLILSMRTATTQGPVGRLLEAVFSAVFRFALNSPWALFLCLLSATLLIVVLSWPLMMRTPVKPAK